MLFVSGEHTAESHSGGKGLLTVKQQHAIRTAVRSAPLQSGGAVHANLKNFSPGRHVPTDRRSMEAVARRVRKERKELMAERVPGQKIDGSEGAMTKLAMALSLKTAIERHNDPNDDYHMDAHQVVCCGYQFKDGVRLMVLSTPSLIANMARAIECGWHCIMADCRPLGRRVRLVQQGLRPACLRLEQDGRALQSSHHYDCKQRVAHGLRAFIRGRRSRILQSVQVNAHVFERGVLVLLHDEAAGGREHAQPTRRKK